MKKIIYIFILSILLTSYYNCYAIDLDCKKTLTYGDNNIEVKKMQKLLNIRTNCKIVENGIFNNETLSCVKDYQKINGLEIDGIVGPITCNYLIGNTPVTEYEDNGARYGIITGEKVNIRKGADTSSRIINETFEGNIYPIDSQINDWYKIVYAKNKKGYINKENISIDFILVDLSIQRLYYFSDGQRIWSTSVVTGMKNIHDTPTGVYELDKDNFSYKTTLTGSNDDGSIYNAQVDYWMPFNFSSGIGFHDAEWRVYSEFNKKEYLTNGSHGCVNMNHIAAEKLFNEDFDTIDVIVRD